MRGSALRFLANFLPTPVQARHAEWSVISSVDDLAPSCNGRLVDILLEAANLARYVDLSAFVMSAPPNEARLLEAWPGEHYRLLTGLARAWGASCAVEVGTFKGHGAAALAAGVKPGGRVVTYDVAPWTAVPGAILANREDIEQRVGDLGQAEFRMSQMETLNEADMIFVDGPKDGVFEWRFLEHVLLQLSDRERLIVFDDIRVVSMVKFWRSLPFPKLDATSLGHWSGTGLAIGGGPMAANPCSGKPRRK